MKTPLRFLLSLFLIILFLFVSGIESSSGAQKKIYLQYEGEIIVPGLTDNVTVYRDERGMPHIYAGSEFYLSQIKTYLDGKFYKDSFSGDVVKTSAKYVLVLKPEK